MPQIIIISIEWISRSNKWKCGSKYPAAQGINIFLEFFYGDLINRKRLNEKLSHKKHCMHVSMSNVSFESVHDYRNNILGSSLCEAFGIYPLIIPM